MGALRHIGGIASCGGVAVVIGLVIWSGFTEVGSAVVCVGGGWWLSITFALLAVAGCGYLVLSAILLDCFVRRTPPAPRPLSAGVTILKPLHGLEPGLAVNIASFRAQSYSGPIQIICGVQDENDEAIAVVEQERAAVASGRLDLVVDTTMHGLNHKVSNLINMWRRAEHDIVIVSDSDIRVDHDYLSRIVTELDQRGVGAVTCLYHGFATAGCWSRLAALGINAHFLPNAITGLELGLARPCFGSTIAFKRKTFVETGGFGAVADCLADDYAIGAALRAGGHDIAIPSVTVGHACAETTALEVWRHEVRWARTIRTIDPVGYAGSIITHAFPLALIAALAGGLAGSFAPAFGIGLCITALLCRLALFVQVAQAFALPLQSRWLVPVRDLWSLGVFVWGCFGQTTRWKGHEYRFLPGGALAISRSSSPS
jgi:ceramide glucosyltransferase